MLCKETGLTNETGRLPSRSGRGGQGRGGDDGARGLGLGRNHTSVGEGGIDGGLRGGTAGRGPGGGGGPGGRDEGGWAYSEGEETREERGESETGRERRTAGWWSLPGPVRGVQRTPAWRRVRRRAGAAERTGAGRVRREGDEATGGGAEEEGAAGGAAGGC